MITDFDITTPPDWAKKDVKGMYLFGSRSMAVRKPKKDAAGNLFDINKIKSRITEDTDYDFACQYSTDIEAKLVSNGWTKCDVEELYHPCKILKALYVKTGSDGKNVQILLRSNQILFEKAWDSIDPAFWYKFIWKSSPDFKFKKLKRKDQKEIISSIVDQLYATVNMEYQFY